VIRSIPKKFRDALFDLMNWDIKRTVYQTTPKTKLLLIEDEKQLKRVPQPPCEYRLGTARPPKNYDQSASPALSGAVQPTRLSQRKGPWGRV
jgi:hypothetical protein